VPTAMLPTPLLFCGVAQCIRMALEPSNNKAGWPHTQFSERASPNPRCSTRGDNRLPAAAGGASAQPGCFRQRHHESEVVCGVFEHPRPALYISGPGSTRGPPPPPVGECRGRPWVEPFSWAIISTSTAKAQLLGPAWPTRARFSGCPHPLGRRPSALEPVFLVPS